MHPAKFRVPLHACCISAWDNPPLFGSRYAQARWAVSYWDLLTPSCCAVSFGIDPLLSGSGKLVTPSERMHWEKASGPFDAELLGKDDPPAEDDPTVATPGPDGPCEQPPAAIAAAASAVTAGHARRIERRRLARRWVAAMSISVPPRRDVAACTCVGRSRGEADGLPPLDRPVVNCA
jgi:hypothetical protein